MMQERHADPVDQAAAYADTLLSSALRARRPEGPAPNGHCLNCNEPVPSGHRWCNADCRDDWQQIEARAAERACVDE